MPCASCGLGQGIIPLEDMVNAATAGAYEVLTDEGYVDSTEYTAPEKAATAESMRASSAESRPLGGAVLAAGIGIVLFWLLTKR